MDENMNLSFQKCNDGGKQFVTSTNENRFRQNLNKMLIQNGIMVDLNFKLMYGRRFRPEQRRCAGIHIAAELCVIFRSQPFRNKWKTKLTLYDIVIENNCT